MALCKECLDALPESLPGPRLALQRHVVSSQLALHQETAGMGLYSRAAVKVCTCI